VSVAGDTPDIVEWVRGSGGFTVKSQYWFLPKAPHISSSLHHIWEVIAIESIVLHMIEIKKCNIEGGQLKRKKKKKKRMAIN
jgi:hypothetical protein